MTPRPSRFVVDGLDDEGSLPEQSEEALALEFSAMHADTLRFDGEFGRWYRWNGKIWEPDLTGHVLDDVRALCRAKAAACVDERIACRIASAATSKAVERLARTDRRHVSTSTFWDADPWLLNTPRGVVDLRTGTLRPSLRDDHITRTTNVEPGGPIRLWESFLNRITDGDRDLQSFLKRTLGYVLTGSTEEHAFFFLLARERTANPYCFEPYRA